MARRLKFRVWDRINNCFSEEPFFRITIAKDGKIYNSENDTWYQFDDRYVINQFTGLNDKNGKEIYESDICRILYSDWPSNTSSEISLEDYLISISSIGKIEFESYSYFIMLKDRYGDYFPSTLNHGKHGFIEVIGNIYENPDLLKH